MSGSDSISNLCTDIFLYLNTTSSWPLLNFIVYRLCLYVTFFCRPPSPNPSTASKPKENIFFFL